MAKKKKGISTPAWITEGYESKEEYEKANKNSSVKTSKTLKKGSLKENKNSKVFRIRECPKCKSDNVGVVVGQDTKDEWECRSCGWRGKDIVSKELDEDEFMKYLDERGEEVA